MKPAKPIHVGILSTCSKPADVDGNLDQIASFARQASADGVDILLTPEMSATGYGPYEDVLALAEIAGQGPIFRRLAEIAKETNVVITAGFVEQGPQPAIRYLSHYVVWPDGQFIAQRKNRATLAEKPLCPGVELIPPDYVNAPP
ncbi:MAG TPA: carbon-nitrogen hydrolase family protein, partial [Tepidisphaeraceae bacterium]